jgi:hypothetical protein
MFVQRLRVLPIIAVIGTILFGLIVVSSARTATPPTSAKAKHDLTINKVSPPVPSIAAGTKVTITGTGFAAGAKVFFNDTQATDVTVVSGTVITATVPENVVTTPIDVAVLIGQEAAAFSHGANAVVRGYKNDKSGPGKGNGIGNGPSSSNASTSDTPTGTTAVQPKPPSR